jgi:beta-phosphoglucomutase-like phosphatase (HAD superfamily)
MNPPQFGQPDALIFDMDGVLINSEPLHERAKREALLEAGIIVPESSVLRAIRAVATRP